MVSKLQSAVSNYSRPQILDTLNEVLTIVYSENMAQTIAIDAATGQPPTLDTIEGTFEYDLPLDCRELEAVIVDTGSTSNAGNYGVPVFGTNNNIVLFNKEWVQIPATSISLNGAGGATVTFTQDPGTTTDYYSLFYYKAPPEIETEDDEIPLPNELHYLLRQAVLAMLNTENYGQTGFDNSVFENVIKQIRNRMNRGTQAKVTHTPVRLQDMNFASNRSCGYGRSRY
jgi:hypothetical protein